jgi:hypothetical protein
MPILISLIFFETCTKSKQIGEKKNVSESCTMAQPISSQTMNGIRTLVDDTFPFTCVIESSQLVEGHGVINKIEFYFDN